MFSVGASKLAAKATESALKFGEIASQKVVQVSETVGEKVKALILISSFIPLLLFCFFFVECLSHSFYLSYSFYF